MIPERKVFLLDRCELLLDLLLEYTNLAEINDDIHNVPDLTGYDNSGLNCLDCIGRMKDPNVTSIAEAMNMTKGAISKIIRKLSDKGTLVDYQLDGNRQKVYYTLSDKGKTLFAMAQPGGRLFPYAVGDRSRRRHPVFDRLYSRAQQQNVSFSV